MKTLLKSPWNFIVVILSLGLFLALWKSQGPNDWISDHGADLLAALAGAIALVFLAHAARLQTRQISSSEVLTAYELARPDLEILSRNIAVNARLIVDIRKGGKPGKLAEYDEKFFSGDRTIFARRFDYLKLTKESITNNNSCALLKDINLYIALYKSIIKFSSDDDIVRFTKSLPLGRAYCALKVAREDDGYEKYLEFLNSILPQEQ